MSEDQNILSKLLVQMPEEMKYCNTWFISLDVPRLCKAGYLTFALVIAKDFPTDSVGDPSNRTDLGLILCREG